MLMTLFCDFIATVYIATILRSSSKNTDAQGSHGHNLLQLKKALQHKIAGPIIVGIK